MNRRQLLQGALAASIAPQVDAMQRLVAPSMSRDLNVLSAAPVPSHLDTTAALSEYLETQRALRNVDPGHFVVLDLARYETASPAALRLLGSLPVGWADIGMRSLGLATARHLGSWRTRAYLFVELRGLTADEAWALVPPASRPHAMHFEALDSLDVEAARGLVAAAAGSSLCLKLSRASSAVVRELARHEEALVVGLRHGDLDDSAQRMLGEQYRRYRAGLDQ